MKIYQWISLVVVGALTSCTGEKSYWDDEIARMCQNDGGVTIFEHVPMSRDEFDKLPKVGGYASIPSRSSSKSTDKVFWDESIKVLHEAEPRVWRSEQLIKTRGSEKVVARVITYSRVGGDAPSPAHSSRFVCPEAREVFAQREKVFRIEGGR